MKVEIVDLMEIRPYWNNPKNHDKSIEDIKASIVKFGYQSPILVDKKKVIVLGHGRFKALLDLKGNLSETIKALDVVQKKEKDKEESDRLKKHIENLKMIDEGKVPIVIADDLNEKQAKEYRITDNKLTESSSWDEDKLKVELRELETAIGFTDAELSRLLKVADAEMQKFTQEDMTKGQEKFEAKFDNVSKADTERKVELLCPHCLETYFLNRDEIKSLLNNEVGSWY